MKLHFLIMSAFRDMMNQQNNVFNIVKCNTKSMCNNLQFNNQWTLYVDLFLYVVSLYRILKVSIKF